MALRSLLLLALPCLVAATAPGCKIRITSKGLDLGEWWGRGWVSPRGEGGGSHPGARGVGGRQRGLELQPGPAWGRRWGGPSPAVRKGARWQGGCPGNGLGGGSPGGGQGRARASAAVLQ